MCKKANVAQAAEQLFRKQQVGGSSPPVGSTEELFLKMLLFYRNGRGHQLTFSKPLNKFMNSNIDFWPG